MWILYNAQCLNYAAFKPTAHIFEGVNPTSKETGLESSPSK